MAASGGLSRDSGGPGVFPWAFARLLGTALQAAWSQDPKIDDSLRDMRRHFHTFKGNGRAVGANVLGELGWAAQDMLDRVLDGDLQLNAQLQELLASVVAALPALVTSYRKVEGMDIGLARELTNRCFRMAKASDEDLSGDLAEIVSGADNTKQEGEASISVSESIGH